MFKFFTTRRIQPANETDLTELRKRNEERIAKIKEQMGNKWILHPDNNKSRLTEPRPV